MKVIAFDLFGTVFDLTGVDRQEIRDYAAHIRKPEWSPLVLPKSWESLPAFADSRDGMMRLRSGFIVVTCSNAPLALQTRLLKNADIKFDAIVPLEINRVFKPATAAYITLYEALKFEPNEVLMVTANEHFGDLEGSALVGMPSQLIRSGKGNPKTIIELAERLEC